MHLKDVAVGDEVFSIYNIDCEYYEVYDENGNCMNEGEPLYEVPTFEIIRQLKGGEG